MYNAAIARKKTVNNGKRGLEKSWYWIKYFIKSEVRNCNYKTSYNLGESVSEEVKTELRKRLEALGYHVDFNKYWDGDTAIYIEW